MMMMMLMTVMANNLLSFISPLLFVTSGRYSIPRLCGYVCALNDPTASDKLCRSDKIKYLYLIHSYFCVAVSGIY
jgi:hypothetical protein